MMIVFYRIFLLLYKTSARLISPWNRKARLWIEGRKGIFGLIQSSGIRNQNAVIWMHCASLGEFEQGRPVLENIKKQFPSYKFILSFFSPSGYQAKRDYPGADYIFYLPFDSKRNATQFLDMVQPNLVLWVKYEYWFYYLNELKMRKIPTLLVSGVFREDQVFFKPWGGFHRRMLQSFAHFFVQTDISKRLLGSIGFSDNVSISGDTRFDRVVEIAGKFEPIAAVEQFCGTNRVIVAGSTWEEDEEELDHFANTHNEIRFIIAPHEIDEERLQEIELLFRRSVRFSVLEKQLTSGTWQAPASGSGTQPSPNVLLIDNIGMLARLYKYATIAYVGGGFGDDGVHNVLEAAVYGKPVVHGPVIEKYVEATELVDCGGSFVIDSALEAEETFNRLLSEPGEYTAACKASSDYVHSRTGATEEILQFIHEKRLLTN